MDDSGYFSVQVISSALELWGLEMIPYNSTEPRAVEAQNNPAEQKAYICNYRDHWFTIRRLANQWFNLNSLLTGPELISNTYLAMFLAQLQQEGYSIFVVCGELPPCAADEALLLRPAVQSQKPKLLSEVAKSQQQSQESDDSELQKAIRMSLGQGSPDEVVDLVEDDEEEQVRQAVLLSLQSQTPTHLPEVDPVELRQRRLAYLESSGTKVNT